MQIFIASHILRHINGISCFGHFNRKGCYPVCRRESWHTPSIGDQQWGIMCSNILTFIRNEMEITQMYEGVYKDRQTDRQADR